jgi:hypothetical protein
VGRPMSFFGGKDEKQTVVGVTPVQHVLSRGPREQQKPIHTPLKIGSVVDTPLPPFHFLTTHPFPLQTSQAGVIGLMSLIHNFSHRHQGIPKLTAGFYGIVGVGRITYLLGTIDTLLHLRSPRIVHRIAVGVY